MESDKTVLREWLKKNAKRLIEHLDSKVPDLIVANEIGMIISSGLALCGPDIFYFLANNIQESKRAELGLCVGCGVNPSPNTPAQCPTYCSQCQLEQKAFEKGMAPTEIE